MSVQKELTYDQAWSAMSEIAKACREFNELQFKYRQLAITLILAAYAAIGFFVAQPDPAIKAMEEAKAAYKLRMQETRYAKGVPERKDRVSNSGLQSSKPETASVEETKPSESHVRRMSLMILGIGFLAMIGTYLIWLVDIRVYHSLLRAIFEAGKSFEDRLRVNLDQLPLIHTEMEKRVRGSHPVTWISIFYLLVAVAAVLPWYSYNVLNSATATDWWTDRSISGGAVLAVLLLGIVLWFFIGKLPKEGSPAIGPVTAAFPPVAQGANSLEALLTRAREARQYASAPYSRFSVGASVLAKNHNDIAVFNGCNVENAAYGSTMCAERNALAAAVAAGYSDVREILIFTDAAKPTPPCGACLQVMQELAPNAKVHLASPRGVRETLTVRELFPHPFSGESLKS